MEWELSKENYQPLKRGRDPEKLSQATPSPAVTKSKMEEERRKLWRQIEEYSGPDPLEPWLRLIKWTQESFKTGGQQAELLPLLERCTRELQDKDNYKDDIRYLRVWIQYADCLPEPRDVFSFLKENGIGQDLALFFIAYAAYLELRGNFGKADAVFQAGLQKMALPVQKLRSKYEAFQERMKVNAWKQRFLGSSNQQSLQERRRLRKLQDGEDPSAVPVVDGNGREALGVLKSRGRETGLRRPARGLARQEAPGVRSNSGGSQLAGATDKENAGGFEVFVDEQFKAGGPGDGGYDLELRRTAGGWENLGSFESTRKENEQRPAKWKGNTYKQKAGLMPKPEHRLEIPVDEELKEVESVHRELPKGTLQQRVEAAAGSRHLEEKLQKDPLRLFRDPEQAADAPRRAAEERRMAANAKPGPEIAPVEEFSFEEVRAKAWFARKAAAKQQEPASPSNSEDMAISRTPGTDTGSRKAPVATTGSSPWFNNIGHAGQTGPLHGQTMSGAAGPGDVTMATQAAFESINGMFKGALPHDCAWESADPTATVRLTEPTVTLSSRAAFDAVNSMFQATLPLGEGARRQDAATMGRPRSSSFQATASRRASRAAEDDQTGAFQVYEDTDFLPGKGRKSSVADQTETFAPYQDTEFLLKGGRRSKESLGGMDRDTEFLTGKIRGRASRTDQTTEFLVYEDTNLL